MVSTTLLALSALSGASYLLVMVATAGRRYDLLRPRFFLYSAPGIALQAATTTFLLGRYRLVVPTILLVALAVRTVRVERERGDDKPFISTLQLWPLELAVFLAAGGVEFLVSSWLGLSTAPLV